MKHAQFFTLETFHSRVAKRPDHRHRTDCPAPRCTRSADDATDDTIEPQDTATSLRGAGSSPTSASRVPTVRDRPCVAMVHVGAATAARSTQQRRQPGAPRPGPSDARARVGDEQAIRQRRPRSEAEWVAACACGFCRTRAMTAVHGKRASLAHHGRWRRGGAPCAPTLQLHQRLARRVYCDHTRANQQHGTCGQKPSSLCFGTETIATGIGGVVASRKQGASDLDHFGSLPSFFLHTPHPQHTARSCAVSAALATRTFVDRQGRCSILRADGQS